MIKKLFTQDVNRDIETVVKADDVRNVDQEIKEYVITREIDKKVGSLFSEYGNSKIVNGVWIHGFFGSGKSHLLKMLSYVFGNKVLEDGTSAAEVFASKSKDELIKADIHRIANIPSESILFNIDQQATISQNEDKDSVLLVFFKVLYDHLGFYGFQPHIAEFEWWVRFRKNIYIEFKEQFVKQTGLEWTTARRNYFDPEVMDGVSSALAQLLDREESDFDTILEDIEERQNLSVADLANRVEEYINTQPANFHLNFFIDEVGQYIAGDVNMMLNLQTIAESLATATNNRSWVFATAQSKIEGLGKDLDQTQDYARIQGRFKIQINLTSANVDEVIEKRLLEKKKQEVPVLSQLYEKEKAHIKTIVSSADGGMPIVAYKNEEDFVRKYPFFYYQFSLFQSCRTSLAEHDIFQGKHASVGERSMLGVFQSVLKDIENEDLLAVASFDKMYKGIENDLRAEFVTSINNAQTNLNDDFALKVFKTLFLVKYYKQFLATKENIAMLLIDHIHIDIQAHQERVNKALDKLEYHAYIERNAEIYEFLTNKEKDIETEIRKTEIEESKVNQMMKELFFDEVIGRNRIRFDANKQEYDFTPKLDGGTFGREHELSVEIFTPNYDNESTELLKAQTMGMPVLRIVTDDNREFVDDVRMYLKVQSYNSLNQSASNSNETRSILYQKMSDNTRRRQSLKNRANELLGSAKAFVNGTQLDLLPRSSGQTFVVECFQHLIKITYPNLRMLGNTIYTEETFKRIVKGFQVPGLFDEGDASVSEAETQLLNFVKRRKSQHERTSLYDLKNHFIKKPFGWYNNATFSLLSKLYKKNKVEVTVGENPLDEEGLIDALLNSAKHKGAFVVGQTVYSSRQIQQLKELYRDLFDTNTVYNDARDIGNDFKERLTALTSDVSTLLAQKNDFPFVKVLEDFYDNLRHLTHKNYNYFIEYVDELDDLLVDTKEEDYDPIKSFVNGQQAKIYSNIVQTVNSNRANIDFVEGDEFKKLEDFLSEPKPYYGNVLREAEQYREELTDKVKNLLEKERNETIERIQKELSMLNAHPEVLKLSENDKESIIIPIVRKMDDAKTQRFIGNLRSTRSELSSMVECVLNNAVKQNRSSVKTHSSKSIDTKTQSQPTVSAEPLVHYINKNNISIAFDKTELITEDDVHSYLEVLKQKWIEEIRKNRRIRL